MISSYLIDIIILLIAAVVAVPFFQSIKLGAVPGFLVAGILVGPYGLKLITNINEISNLAEIGVVFLLFVIGMELKPTRLWQMRRLVFGLGSLQVLLTGLMIGSASYLFFDVPLNVAILLGPALALSSTAFVLQILSEKKLLTSVFGRTSFSVLLLQDLAVVPLLALIPLLTLPNLTMGEDVGLALIESVLILGVVVIVGRYLLHPLLHRVALSANPEIFTASAVLLVIGTALATEHAGFSMAMGAFLAGLLISDSSYKHQIMAEVQPFRGLLLGLFFMSMGMSFNIELLISTPVISLSLVILLIAIKIAVLFPLTLLFNIKLKNGLATSLVLAQSGEFALVLFTLAWQSNLLTTVLYQQLLLIVLLSMLITPILSQMAQRIVSTRETKLSQPIEKPEAAPLMIAGFGRVGRRIGEILVNANRPFIALDSDVDIVENARADNYPVFYGDLRNPEVLKAAGANRAEIIIVTLNDKDASEKIVASLRESHPDKIIYVRGHSLSQCKKLRQLGASGVVSENVEASLELARLALDSVGIDIIKQDALLNDFRKKYHAQIDNMDYQDDE